MTRSDGRRAREPARRHPRPLHRAPRRRAGPARVDVRRRARVRGRGALRQGDRDQLPPGAARPADASAGDGRRRRVQGLDRLRRARHVAARLAAVRVPPRRRSRRCPWSGSSTPGPPTSCWPGPPHTPRPPDTTARLPGAEAERAGPRARRRRSRSVAIADRAGDAVERRRRVREVERDDDRRAAPPRPETVLAREGCVRPGLQIGQLVGAARRGRGRGGGSSAGRRADRRRCSHRGHRTGATARRLAR